MHGIVSHTALTGHELSRAPLTGRQWSEFMLKLETAGLESKLAQRVIESKGNFLATRVVNLIANRGYLRELSPTSMEKLALRIMGNDIIFPLEITEAHGLSYTDNQVELLSVTMPTFEVMEELNKNGFAQMPLPPEPLSLLDLLNGRPEYFYSTHSKTPPWYADPEQTFARNEKTGFGWIVVKKAPIKSTSSNWDGQNKVILSGVGEGRMPNAAEMVWFISTFKDVRDIWLFPETYVHTSSVAANGNPVFVGRCDSDGIGILNHNGISCGGSVGVFLSECP
jgi:hypothetical protein